MTTPKEDGWKCRRCGKKFAHDKLVYQSYVAKTGTCKKCTPAEKEHLRKMLAAREKKP
jgi:ribosomal protein L37E